MPSKTHADRYSRQAAECEQNADPSLTPFDRREFLNRMKEAEVAPSAGLKELLDGAVSTRGGAAVRNSPSSRLRILKLDV
jgi:hypothetical protein